MNKEQAINYFWNSFGVKAYDENTVPDEAELPYITYSVATGSLGDVISMTANVWDRSTSWKTVTDLKNAISESIGYGGKVIKIDAGYIYLTRGSLFSQRGEDDDDMIRRIYLQVQAEFLTEN